jgi:phosphosulfolactate phosphohydrolase-like enzyme
MRIRIAEFIAGARAARGAVVIIDVFRATTTQAVILSRTGGPLHVFATFEHYQRVRPRLGPMLVFSELPLPLQLLDNSPHQAQHADLQGRIPVSITTNGTKGLAAAPPDSPTFIAGFVNAGATVAHLREQAYPKVTLVAMGRSTLQPPQTAIEDLLCARYLAALLRGEAPSMEAIRREILDTVADWLEDRSRTRPWLRRDVELALTPDAFPVVGRLERTEPEGLLFLTAVHGAGTR